MNQIKYPHLQKFSSSIKIAPEKLVQAFEIEKKFHDEILKESSFERRQVLYSDLYSTVHKIYGKNQIDIQADKNPKDKIVRLFKKELEGKSVLDVGCGQGYFLASIAKLIPGNYLMGIDVSIPSSTQNHPDIDFEVKNIIDFKLNRKFDIVFSDQVIEHIAPSDLPIHLESIKKCLNEDGKFIINMPNRLFGPVDVTRIIDFTHSGKVEPQGSHLNESTYNEMIIVLKEAGFTKFQTVSFVPKLKHVLKSYRFTPSIVLFIERHEWLLDFFRSIKINGHCVFRFGITLICSR